MKIIHALEPLQKSIFLAGPVPRVAEVKNWRPGALEILQRLGFDGAVLVPEARGWLMREYSDEQLFWEWEGLASASVIVFWVPRHLGDMPAFNTNVEFGLAAHSGKCVLGYPPEAPKMAYLTQVARRYAIPVFSTLEETLAESVRRCQQKSVFTS